MSDEAQPRFRVVKGQPTDEELAAVVAVLEALAARPGPEPVAPPTSGWAAYWRTLRAPVPPGPSGWQAAGRL